MKLFTKEIDNKLFDQYQKGSDLENQKVVAKIFNPYGRGTWYLLNSDPQDPDYIWAIVDLFEVEMGSVSRSELESIKVPPFGLGLERDLSFTPINAYELYMGLLNGKQYAEGGMMAKGGGVSVDLFEFYDQQPPKLKKIVNKWASKYDEDELDYKQTEKFLKEVEAVGYTFDYGLDNMPYGLRPIGTELEMDWEQGGIMANGGQTSLFEEGGNVAQQNKEMLKNQAKEFMHHSQELNSLVDKTKQVDAWVVAKAERASTDLSDITHYLDGRIMAKGGMVVTSIKDIPNFEQRLDEGKITYRGLGLGKKFNDFYDLAGEGGRTIKVDGKEYNITDTEFNTFARGKDGKMRIKFDAPFRKFEDGGMMAKGGVTTKFKVGDKVKIDYISDYDKHNGEIGKITWLNEYKYYPNGDYSVVEKRTQAQITYKDGSTEMISDLYTKGSGLVSPVKKIKEDGGMMAKGGATFKDKVNAISKRLEGTKVPTRLKKDYGATYDKKEAKQAGQRIAGSMIQKLKMRKK